MLSWLRSVQGAHESLKYKIFISQSTRTATQMEKKQQRSVIGALMVVLGFVQATWAISSSDLVFAGLGLAYAGFGVLYLWFEVYRDEQ
ncbi:type IV conjugative transfer system pilin TraA [Halorubrum halophilum]|uniref:type IV conjugative transfer system pilin TraA n=1 Tax=Halorubrum halophilum TaxID=413816 RepID=UPI003741FA3A